MSTDSAPDTDPLMAAAHAWLAADPDPDTRSELEHLLAVEPDEVRRRFSSRLRFGTAGLRGALGAGPSRMNRVIVRLTARAIGERLLAGNLADRGVVLGYDARRNSDVFALDSARVLTAQGIACRLASTMTPTPLLSFATHHYGAGAGIMVTASHNPPQDNGYKVYWSDGAQIIPPVDSEIEALIGDRPLVDDDELAPEAEVGILDYDELLAAYLDTVIGPRRSGPPAVPTVYTPIHGVGLRTTMAAFDRAGLTRPTPVPEQAEPDGTFPTVTLPNPEEKGTLDLALALGEKLGARLILAQDPDADRLGVVAGAGTGFRRLTGDQTGLILADHLLGKGSGADRVVVNSVVSSTMLSRIAEHHGVQYRSTLTGFKWIIRAAIDEPQLRYVMGYEEALGYAVCPEVRDKDGVSAAVVMSELVAELAADGLDLTDRIDELETRHGVNLTHQVARRFDDQPDRVPRLMDQIRRERPTAFGPLAVQESSDWSHDHTPAADLLMFHLQHRSRVVIRPSGTEPKIKCYLEVNEPLTGDLAAAREVAGARMNELEAAVADLLETDPR